MLNSLLTTTKPMKKFLIAAAAAVTLCFLGAALGFCLYNATVATVAVAYCRYQMGYNTMEEVIDLSENYLANQGYSSTLLFSGP